MSELYKNWKLYFTLISCFIIIVSYSGCFTDKSDSDDAWGAEGELSLTLSLDKHKMKFNETISANCTVTNVGKTKLRFLDYIWPNLILRDSNNSTPAWVGPVYDIGEPDENDLITLKPGESYFRIRRINIGYWALEKNETYRVTASYISHDWKELGKPYWRGKLVSNEETFFVKG